MADIYDPRERREVFLNAIRTGDTNDLPDPENREELFLSAIAGNAGLPEGVSYTTTAPTAANTDGLKFVVLSSDPGTKYPGWFYIITGA